MRNNSRAVFMHYKKMHESGEFSRLYTYIHSLMTGVSVAFFIGLFSAGPTAVSCSIYLLIAAILFSFSLALNALFSVFFLFFGVDKQITFKLYTYNKLMNHLSNFSILLPFIAFVLLFFYFSHIIGWAFLIFLIVIFIFTAIIITQMLSKDNELHKFKLNLIENGNISEYEEFEKLHEFPIFNDDERREMSLEYGLLVLLKGKLTNFLNKGKFDKENVELMKGELISSLINICNTRAGDHELNLRIKKAIDYFGKTDLKECEIKKHVNEIISKIDNTGSVYFLI
ncbi:hypothetical protein [Providencia manganoxydans]|uniref:hypothetical protein n=1 Tax=Providencia manganoxydans TaxID=2923283 RepID=UPI0034E5120B